ncbi:hypothetical protein [Pseudofulvibacter geojedonensis]|uniref:Uncharacterized protein n=1 Tax=Pseudofulvibacter geojedonensis TaxID=1123758 RepID=A0ABW3I4M4_9FLAO
MFPLINGIEFPTSKEKLSFWKILLCACIGVIVKQNKISKQAGFANDTGRYLEIKLI